MSHRPAAVILAILLLPCVAAPAETTPESRPQRVPRPSHLLTLGRAFNVEAKGCESHGKRFVVTAIQPIDRSKPDKKQILSGVFLRKREPTARSGWRNVGPEGSGGDYRAASPAGALPPRAAVAALLP